MHDDTLGPPVDLRVYDGPLLDGKPLHSGSCTDSTHGCRACNRAATVLSDEQLGAIGWPTRISCDWCKRRVRPQETRGVYPWDEPTCYYEVCLDCYERSRAGEEVDQRFLRCVRKRNCSDLDCTDCTDYADD